VLPEPIKREPLVIYVYCDESGNKTKKEWVSVCAYRIPQRGLDRIKEAWRVCRDRNAVPSVHMRDIYRPEHFQPRPNREDRWLQIKTGKGPKWIQWRDEMLGEFASIISECCSVEKYPITPMGCVVDGAYFQSGNCESLARKSKANPIHFAFSRMITEYLANAGDPACDVSIVVDDGPESAEQIREWVNKIKYGPDRMLGAAIKSLCFVDDFMYPLVQAADMLAFTATQRMVENLPSTERVPESVWKKLTMDGRFEPEVLDSSRLDELEAEAK
jgi:hypothetical protein